MLGFLSFNHGLFRVVSLLGLGFVLGRLLWIKVIRYQIILTRVKLFASTGRNQLRLHHMHRFDLLLVYSHFIGTLHGVMLRVRHRYLIIWIDKSSHLLVVVREQVCMGRIRILVALVWLHGCFLLGDEISKVSKVSHLSSLLAFDGRHSTECFYIRMRDLSCLGRISRINHSVFVISLGNWKQLL